MYVCTKATWNFSLSLFTAFSCSIFYKIISGNFSALKMQPARACHSCSSSSSSSSRQAADKQCAQLYVCYKYICKYIYICAYVCMYFTTLNILLLIFLSSRQVSLLTLTLRLTLRLLTSADQNLRLWSRLRSCISQVVLPGMCYEWMNGSNKNGCRQTEVQYAASTKCIMSMCMQCMYVYLGNICKSCR